MINCSNISRFNVNFLFGFKYFYFFKYFILFPILIPRNDSLIFFYVIDKFFDKNFTNNFLELGSGSGALSYVFRKFFFINMICVDYNFYAIYIFCKNSKNFKIDEIYINQCDWFYVFLSFKRFYIILSNPPYLSSEEGKIFYSNCVSECKYSLISKSDGFDDLFSIIKNSYINLSNNGYLFLEHSYSQAKIVRSFMILIGFVNVCTYIDSSNINRISIGEK